jgi:hypothetical protein
VGFFSCLSHISDVQNFKSSMMQVRSCFCLL